MADVTGISVDIGNIIAKAQEADKAIETLAKNGIKNLKNLSDRGVEPLISQFNQLLNTIGGKGKSIKFEIDTSKAISNIDDVNRAIKSISSKKATTTTWKNFGDNIKVVEDRIKNLSSITKQYEDKFSEKGAKYNPNKSSIYREAKKELTELSSLFVDLTNKQQKYIENYVKIEGHKGFLRGNLGDEQYKLDMSRMKEFYTEEEKLSKKNDELIEQNRLAELKQISDSVEAKRKASEEAIKLAQKEHDAKQKDYEKMGKEWDKAERDKAKATEDRLKKQQRLIEQYNNNIRRGEGFGGNALSSKRAMQTIDIHSNASSVNQNLAAISALNNAKRNLNQNDKDYKKTLDAINNALLKHKTALSQAGFQTKEFDSQNKSFMGTLGQLRNALAGVFAVTSIVGYVNKLVKIRGEFELQHKSLQVLLQDKDKADALWDKTVQLAVKSPFRVKDLVTYTKQLAAYRVEADKLYETNKMLADVSAGLGVDMDRLILAFGQVKAANYLRGTELRQFSEAGINILKELADEYTRVEGRIVTVGDVFQRVSKRMVSFADVEKVFQKVTSAGGVFYKMQEKQAETTIGLLNNLKDVVDVALNDIGEANDGVIKGVLKTVTALVKQWEKLVPVIKTVGVAFVAYKLHTLAASSSTITLASSLGVAKVEAGKTLTMIQLLNLGMKRLGVGVKNLGRNIGSFLKGNALTIAISAIVVGVYELISYFKEYQERLKEIRDAHNELRDEVSSIEMDIKFSEKYEDKEQKLKDLVALAKNKYNIQVDVDVEADKNKVEKVASDIAKAVKERIRFEEWFSLALEKYDNKFFFDFGADDIKEDAEDMKESSQALLSYIEGNRLRLFNLLSGDDRFDKKLVNNLTKPQDEQESDLEYLNRVVEAYYELYKIDEKWYKAHNADGKHWGNYSWTIPAYTKEVYRFKKDSENLKEEIEGFFADISPNIMAEKNVKLRKTKVNKNIETAFKDYGSLVVEYVKKLASEKFEIPLDVKLPPPEEKLSDWMIAYNKLVDTFTSGVVKKVNATTDKDSYVNALKGNYEFNKEILDGINAGVGFYVEKYGEDKGEYEKKVAEQEAALNFFNALDKQNNKKLKTALDILKERISLIKEIAKEYNDLRKNFSKEESIQRILSSYSDTWKEIMGSEFDLKSFDFTSKEGVVSQLEELKNKVPSKAKELIKEIKKAISGEQVEIDVEARVEKAKELNDQVESLFNDYELSLELDKLGIPPDLASQLFGIDSISLPELRANLESKRGEFIGTDQEDKYKEWLKKLSELEDKHRLENLKKYSKYLVKAQSERVKIKLEELRQIEEIESLSDVDDSTKMRMREGVREETQKKLSDLEWEEFKSSDMYIDIFNDLEHASNTALSAMITRLSKMKDSLKELDPSDLKEIVNAINKAKEALANKDPFKAIANNMKKAKQYRMDAEMLNMSYLNSYDEEARIRKEADDLAISIKDREEEFATETAYRKQQLEQGKELTEEEELYYNALQNILREERERLDVMLKQAVAQGKITAEIAKQIREGADAESAVANGLDTISDIFGSLSKNIDELKEGLEGFGDIGAFGDILSIGSTLSSGAQGITSSFKDFKNVGSIWNKTQDENGNEKKSLNVGNLIGKVGGVMGIAGAAAQAVSSIINVGAAIHDARIEKEIQAEIELVDKLGKQYENLEERIDEAYSIDKLNRANTMAKNNLEAQIDSYRKMIKLEEDKKNTDDARIKEWQEKIADAQEQLRELEEKFYEELGGFGSDLAYKDTVNELIDIWFDYFKETGNGLDGLQDKWDEYFDNIIKKQMLMRGAQAIIEPTLRTLDSMLSDGIMTEDEWQNIQKMSDSTNEKLNEYLSKFADRYGVLMDSDTSDLTGLQRGIQGVTEATSQVIEALLNSIRFFVADNNTQLKIIAGSYNTEDTPNPMLAQLKVIAAQTTAIRNLLDSVTFVHPRGGRGFKVVI